MDIATIVTSILGISIWITIVLANYFQLRTLRKFSGLIGRVMFWYSIGLVMLLALTAYEYYVGLTTETLPPSYIGTMALFLIACLFFLRGASIIK